MAIDLHRRKDNNEVFYVGVGTSHNKNKLRIARLKYYGKL